MRRLFLFLFSILMCVCIYAQEKTLVFAANNNTKEVTASLPHQWADWDGELDLIIQELYALQFGGYCDPNEAPVVSGDAPAVTAVSAGIDANNNHYITISPNFEGTATVTGKYWTSEGLVDESFTYSLVVSIKSDKPVPIAIKDVQGDKLQTTKFFMDGQIFIERDGKIYNAMGIEIK